MESKATSKVFDLCRGEHLSECISDHISSGAVNKAQGAPLDDSANEVIADIDVLGLHVVTVVLHESNHGLIV